MVKSGKKNTDYILTKNGQKWINQGDFYNMQLC